MAESNIAWTDYTYNLWRGCTKYGPGCDHCYAEARDKRYERGLHWGKGAPRILASAATRNAPYKWNADVKLGGPRLVFAASLADVFDEEVDPDWRWILWKIIRETPDLRWQLVTKRIGLADAMLPRTFPTGFEHVGIISTVVTQKEADRDVPVLLNLKARRGVTWVGLSIEPQLGAIDLWNLIDLKFNSHGEQITPSIIREHNTRLDWVISGGESLQNTHHSGTPPRLYNLAWARSLRDQCATAGVAYFQKQLGASPIEIPEASVLGPWDFPHVPVPDVWVRLKDRRAGADPSEWPADLRVQQFPEALR